MIKTILISAVSVSALGAGAADVQVSNLAPKAVEIATGPIKFKATSKGISSVITPDKGLAIIFVLKSGRTVRLSL